MKLLVRLNFEKRNPLRFVEWIIASLTIVGGLYVVSPLFEYATTTYGAGALVQTIAHPTGILIFGVLFLASGLLMAAGLWKNKRRWRAYGLFANFVLRTYVLCGTWLTIGFLPLTWLSNFGLLLIAIVLYLVIRWEQKE